MLDSLLTVRKELTQTERECILHHFKNLPQNERNHTNHFDIDLEGKLTLFVKYGSDVLAEASTQSFFHALAQKDESAPGIPKVYDAFREEGYCFSVMEKIESPTLSACEISEDDAVQIVASTIKWLLAQLPSVHTSIFGRISSEQACVWHPFFKDHRAPLPFANVDALTKYVTKAFSRLPGKPKVSISFSGDLAIYHSDITKENFLHDIRTGKTWIVDFQHIGALPVPFQTYGFFNIGRSFAAAVGRHLGHRPSDIANNMTKASGLLQQLGGDGSLSKHSSGITGT
ncbi:hypothetical protein FRB99_004807 [Tulasnella sp. 403]|nr:hypothetical protein FRB99_004807 [Tulasnella sp. 403]